MTAKLPEMTFDYLSSAIAPGKTRKIGYATHATNESSSVSVFHHGNRIAVIARDHVKMTHCGWNSRTTSDRLHKIARANGVGRVFIRGGEMFFESAEGGEISFDSTAKIIAPITRR